MRFEAIPLNAPALEDYARRIAETHANGGLLAAKFRVLGLANSGSLLPDASPEALADFFSSFLNSEAVRVALPTLGAIGQEEPTRDPLGFARSPFDGLTLDGEFAHVLLEGGAYERFSGKPREAKAIGVATYVGLFGDRFQPLRVYRSDVAWAEFFFDVAYDVSWLICDDTARELTLICITDTD